MANVSLIHLGILLFIGLTVAMANGGFRLHCIYMKKTYVAYGYLTKITLCILLQKYIYTFKAQNSLYFKTVICHFILYRRIIEV